MERPPPLSARNASDRDTQGESTVNTTEHPMTVDEERAKRLCAVNLRGKRVAHLGSFEQEWEGGLIEAAGERLLTESEYRKIMRDHPFEFTFPYGLGPYATPWDTTRLMKEAEHVLERIFYGARVAQDEIRKRDVEERLLHVFESRMDEYRATLDVVMRDFPHYILTALAPDDCGSFKRYIHNRHPELFDLDAARRIAQHEQEEELRAMDDKAANG